MKIRSPLLTRLISFSCVYILRLLYSTCRMILVEEEPYSSPYTSPALALKYDRTSLAGSAQRKYLYCMWHDILLMSVFCGKSSDMAALVSRHQDGSYLAGILKMLSIEAIRGSSRVGGPKAVKQCLVAAEKFHISITPDGPIGPKHRLKQGIVYLASQSGRKIVPVTSCCSRFWRPGAKWTDMLLPKPFSTIYIITGKHFTVPDHQTRDQIKEQTADLEQYMHEFTKKYESFSKTRKHFKELQTKKTVTQSQQRAA